MRPINPTSTRSLVVSGMTDQQTKQPDAQAWLQLHGDYLYKYAVMRLRDATTAEDVVQETLLAALKAYANFQGRGSERTWLVGILKHKITDQFRRLSREAPIGEISDEGPEHNEFFERTDQWENHWNSNYAPTEWHATPAELMEREDFWRVLSDCMTPLPARTATAFTLREVDGLTSEEICKTLSVTVNNLWVMLHRARLHLRNCLERHWFTQKA